MRNPEGFILEGESINGFARENKLNPRVFNYLLNGKIKTYKGWGVLYYIPNKVNNKKSMSEEIL